MRTLSTLRHGINYIAINFILLFVFLKEVGCT